MRRVSERADRRMTEFLVWVRVGAADADSNRFQQQIPTDVSQIPTDVSLTRKVSCHELDMTGAPDAIRAIGQ